MADIGENERLLVKIDEEREKIQSLKESINECKQYMLTASCESPGTLHMESMMEEKQKPEDDLETKRMLTELQEEREKIAMLKISIDDFKAKIREYGDEDNKVSTDITDSSDDIKWKARFQGQKELNANLEKQVVGLKERIRIEKKNWTQEGETRNEMTGPKAKKTIIRMTREKQSLESQLRDYEWRLDQEASEFQKAEEKRTAMLKDIAKKVGRHQSSMVFEKVASTTKEKFPQANKSKSHIKSTKKVTFAKKEVPQKDTMDNKKTDSTAPDDTCVPV